MKTLKIGFSRSNKIGSKGLQVYMNKKYSHNFVEYSTKKHMGDDSIYHSAMGTGVGFYSNTRFEEINTKVLLFELEIEEELYTKIRKRLFKECGRDYAYIQNIGIILVDFLKGLGLSLENPFRDGINCSELIFIALEMIHPELKEKYNRNTIRPDHIEEILIEKGYHQIL